VQLSVADRQVLARAAFIKVISGMALSPSELDSLTDGLANLQVVGDDASAQAAIERFQSLVQN
jgi:hypothetical protein